MSKVLIFTTRQMCYDSAGFFAKKLAMNLSKRMVNRAYELYQMKYTWLQIAQKVLQYISSL